MSKSFNDRSFTLLELIIVIIVVGVLATLGFASYSSVLENARNAEAITTLKGWMDTVSSAYIQNNNSELPEGQFQSILDATCPYPDSQHCTPAFYFTDYMKMSSCDGNGHCSVRLIARRCIEGGKAPQSDSVRYVILNWYSNGDRREVIVTTDPNQYPMSAN